jgi:hypothetical protein
MKKKNRSKSTRISGYIQILGIIAKGQAKQKEETLSEAYDGMMSVFESEDVAKEKAAQKRLRKQQKAAACLKK